jgi:flagellar hook-associated protein 1 FlgK
LRLLDDGATDRSDITAVTATRTVSGLVEGGSALPFFTDATDPYSGFITSGIGQSVGIAGRMAVNPDLLTDPSRLVLFSPTTAIGDPQRPNYIYERLTSTAYMFPTSTGLGTADAPHVADLQTYLRQVLTLQGEAASNAASLSQGQSVVVNALRQRIAEEAGVNVDREMAYLISLQTTYAANARVMSVVKEMIDVLLRI